MEQDRRTFLKVTAMGGLAPLISPAFVFAEKENSPSNGTLLNESRFLLQQWCNTLLKYQVRDKKLNGLYGGLLCPACNRVHGRSVEAIFPFMHLAETTNDIRYLSAATALFEWMEHNVSREDGSWFNDVAVSNWNGTTVFTAIAIAEALKHHGHLLSKTTYAKWMDRLKKAADFIHGTFHIKFSNINYPVSATYALTLFGEVFNEPKFTEHGKQLAYEALGYLTPKNKLLFGERGKGTDLTSPKGCYPVDLGYNVEESLPMLTLYALHTKDKKVLNTVIESLRSHMEFMLPDGAWDNSWGTRNFKWTYWGSRTSDGCQNAYAPLADKDPRFYKVALQNLELLRKCTHHGLLHGGPHYASHGIAPCLHHTFCHAKSLASLLNMGLPKIVGNPNATKLPREEAYGVKPMPDIGGWLIANSNWKATVTIYDKEYSFKNGHPSGGALSLLWHQKLGPILAASMNKYHLFEATNMQVQASKNSMPLTLRAQTEDGRFMNISDLNAKASYTEQGDNIVFNTLSKLVDGEQQGPATGRIHCRSKYWFKEESVTIEMAYDNRSQEAVHCILPIISASDEKQSIISENEIRIHKKSGILLVRSNHPMQLLPTDEDSNRIFNHVPGLQALPLQIKGNNPIVTLKAL